MTSTIPASSNAWLEAVAHRDDELQLRIGIRTRLRGSRSPAFGLRLPNGGARVVGPIAAAKINTGGGRVTADFRVPIAAMLGHADPASMVGGVLEAAIELVDDRHAWIDLPERFRGFGVDRGDRRVSLRAASDGILTIRDRRAVRMPALAVPGVAEPRRIMIFANQITFGGGKTKALFELAGMLGEAGHQVTLVALWANNRPPLFRFPDRVGFDHIDGEHVAMPGERERGPSVMGRHNDQASVVTDERLAAYLRASDYDVIYVPNYDSGLHAIFAENRPAHSVLALGDHNGRRGVQAAAGAINPDFLAAARTFDAVHVVNPLIAAELAPSMPREVFVIPNVADRMERVTRDASFFATRRIVTIGRLVPGKRMEHVLDAFALIASRYPRWDLDIYGHGPEHVALLARIGELALGHRARLHGFDPAIGEKLAEGAVVVSASSAEAHPLALIEAMAAGCPVVAYDANLGVRYLIRDGENGFLAPNGDPAALAARLGAVLARIEAADPSLLSVIARGIETTQAFSRDRVQAQWLAKIDELCAARPRPRPGGGLFGWLRRGG